MSGAPKNTHAQRGAALVTVLMIVAAMSVVAIGLTQLVLASTERARTLDVQAQLRHYAIAAEEVALSRVSQALIGLQGRLTVDTPGLAEPIPVPFKGGAMTIQLRDASNCLDLNSLVTGDARQLGEADQGAMTSAKYLFDAVESEPLNSRELIAALVDWFDKNQTPVLGGAEDGYYLGLRPSYRTSGQPLAGLHELLAIRGFSPAIVTAIEPLVCARPKRDGSEPMLLNINTLTEDQAPLLALAFGETLEINEAAQLIASRPLGGWTALETFAEEPSVAQIAEENIQLDRLSVVSSFVEVRADISYRGQVMTMLYLFHAKPGHALVTLRRERIG